MIQTASLACATAAHHVVVAANHVLRQFRRVRPSSIGFYGLARDVFQAATVLGAVMIFAPNAIFAETAKKGLDVAIAIMKDPVISGAIDQSRNQKYESIRTLELVRQVASRVGDRNTSAAGSKRKGETAVETVKMRFGFQLPFVGGAVVSAVGEADIVFAPQGTTTSLSSRSNRQVASKAESASASQSSRKMRPDDFVQPVDAGAESGPEQTSNVSGSGGAAKNGGRGRTRRKTEDTSSAHVVGEGPDGGYEPPAAASAFPPPAPSTVPSSAPHSAIGSDVVVVRPPESTSSKAAKRSSVASSGLHRLSGFGGGRDRPPVIGVRDRIRPNKHGSGSKSSAKPSVIGGLQDVMGRDSSANKKSSKHTHNHNPSTPFSDPQPPPLPHQPRMSSPLSAASPPSVPTNPMPPPTYYPPPQNHQPSNPNPNPNPNPTVSPFHSRAPSVDVGGAGNAPSHSPVSYISQPGGPMTPVSGHHQAFHQDSIPPLEYHPPATTMTGGPSPAPAQPQQYPASSASTPVMSNHFDRGISLGMAGQQLYQGTPSGFDASGPGTQGYSGDTGSIPMGYDPGIGHAHDVKQPMFNPYGTPMHDYHPSTGSGTGMGFTDHTGYGGGHGHLQPQPQQQFGDYPPYATAYDTDTTMAPSGWEAQSAPVDAMSAVSGAGSYAPDASWHNGM